MIPKLGKLLDRVCTAALTAFDVIGFLMIAALLYSLIFIDWT